MSALYADYITENNKTKIIIVAPDTDYLFTANGDYEIVELIVANSTSEINVIEPETFYLEQAYPNPFNPSTSLGIYMSSEDFISVKVYNLMGKEVGELYNGLLKKGYSTFTWNALNQSSGVYIIKAVSQKFSTSQKIMLLK